MNSRSLPEVLHSSKSNNYKIEQLCVFPFLNSDYVIHELKQNYLSIMLQVTMLPQLSTEKDGGKEIVTYCLAGKMLAKVYFLIQPSSAAAERCFSILSNSFTNRQEHSLLKHLLCYNIILEIKFSYCYMY